MAKIRYQFNTKSLKIEKVQVTLKERVRRLLAVLAFGLVFSTVVIAVAYNFFSSPKERMLQREVEQYKLQYKILNDRLDLFSAVLSDLQDRDDNIYRVIFEAEPIPNSVRQAGYGGADRYAKLEGYKNLPIIAMSAGVMLEEKKACTLAGMNGFVSKPTNIDQLTREILKRR